MDGLVIKDSKNQIFAHQQLETQETARKTRSKSALVRPQ